MQSAIKRGVHAQVARVLRYRAEFAITREEMDRRRRQEPEEGCQRAAEGANTRLGGRVFFGRGGIGAVRALSEHVEAGDTFSAHQDPRKALPQKAYRAMSANVRRIPKWPVLT